MQRWPRTRPAGFTVIELVLGATLSGLILMTAISFFAALSREVVRPVIVFAGNNYALAPVIRDSQDGVGKTDVLDALDLHLELTRQIGASDFVAVFGGANINGGIPAASLPISTAFADLTLTAGADPGILTAQQLAASEPAAITANLENSSNAADFTLLVVRGVDAVIAIAQVRRHTTTFEGKPVVLYATTLRSRRLPATSWTNYGYYFWLPADEDVWAVNVGARHYWYRNDTSWWARAEATGSTVVFPDPFALSVNAADRLVRPMSRFSYFINTSPF
jgi:hypothetical protein